MTERVCRLLDDDDDDRHDKSMSSRIRRGRCVRRRWERWSVLYVVHRLLQGLGPDDATPAGISADKLAHRSALLASEVVVGVALLAVIVFIAAFASLIRQAGRDTLATAVTVSGAAFVAMGFISQAAETALVGVADAGDHSAVLPASRRRSPSAYCSYPSHDPAHLRHAWCGAGRWCSGGVADAHPSRRRSRCHA